MESIEDLVIHNIYEQSNLLQDCEWKWAEQLTKVKACHDCRFLLWLDVHEKWSLPYGHFSLEYCYL